MHIQNKFIPKDKNDHKVRNHHHHYTGKYIEAAHSIWSPRYKENSFIPVLAHNANSLQKKKKLIFFELENLKKKTNKKGQAHFWSYLTKFLDSIRLMNLSLDSLVNDFSKNKSIILCINIVRNLKIVKPFKSIWYGRIV